MAIFSYDEDGSPANAVAAATAECRDTSARYRGLGTAIGHLIADEFDAQAAALAQLGQAIG